MFIIKRIRDIFSNDIAMDLGTANTLIYVKNKGIVLNEPSIVAISQKNGNILAVGKEAKEMYGKTPDRIKAIRPMKDGVIADFEITSMMIKYFIRRVHKKALLIKPNIIICVPSGITPVEKRAVIESAEQAGVRKVHLIEEPMAAAIGSKLPIHEPKCNMVVDIGGGTTEVAVISLFATAYCESIGVAGDEMDEAIVRYIRKKYNVHIGIFEGERIKIAIGSAFDLKKKETIEIKGKDLITGTPRKIYIDDKTVRESLNEPVNAIIQAVKRALERISPEMAVDLAERGMVLAGGGSLLRGLGRRLNQETKLRIFRAKDPLTAIVKGTGEVLENFKTLGKVCIN
jgi:rod shape-determining protein MreB